MANTAEMLEKTITSLSNQFIPVYKNLIYEIVKQPMSANDQRKGILYARTQYTLAVFNKIESGFSDEIKQGIALALNNPEIIGLSPIMNVNYYDEHGIPGGALFAILYYALERNAARTQVLFDVMQKLDRLQAELMDTCWHEVIAETKANTADKSKSQDCSRDNSTQSNHSSQRENEQKTKEKEELFLGNLKQAFSRLSSSNSNHIYRSDIKFAAKVIQDVSGIMNIDYYSLDVDKLYRILSIVIFIDKQDYKQRVRIKTIVESIRKNYVEYSLTNDTICHLLAYWALMKSKGEFEYASNEGKNKCNELRDTILEEHRVVEVNTEKANNILADNDLGKIATKPIYTCGRAGSELYLRHLVAADGHLLNWKLSGETSAVTIQGKTDIYTISYSDETPYGILYINPHSEYEPSFAPSGYTFINDPLNYKEPVFSTNTTEAPEIIDGVEIDPKAKEFVDSLLKDMFEDIVQDIKNQSDTEYTGESNGCTTSSENEDNKERKRIRFCRKCGNELQPGSFFCNKCGVKIE